MMLKNYNAIVYTYGRGPLKHWGRPSDLEVLQAVSERAVARLFAFSERSEAFFSWF